MSILIFCGGIEILGQFGHNSPICLRLDFLKVGFDWITCREPQGRTIGINRPRFIVAEQPTRGLDIAAIEELLNLFILYSILFIIDYNGGYFTMSIDLQECPCSGKNMSYFTAPWIPLTLYNYQGTHGYKIKKIMRGYMADLGFSLNITGLYRHLKVFEKRGILSSEWDTPDKGPAKRKYYLTDVGKECLWRWMQFEDHEKPDYSV